VIIAAVLAVIILPQAMAFCSSTRGVIFRLGKLQVRKAGLIFLIPS